MKNKIVFFMSSCNAELCFLFLQIRCKSAGISLFAAQRRFANGRRMAGRCCKWKTSSYNVGL
jgi:hypothetical protein